MITSRWVVASTLSLVAGIALGAMGASGYFRLRENRTTELFARRIRCTELGAEYVKRESDEETTTVSISRVEYVKPSNSCVANVEVFDHMGMKPVYRNWKVVDLISGEALYSDTCFEARGECAQGSLTYGQRADLAFRQAVDGRPVDVSSVR